MRNKLYYLSGPYGGKEQNKTNMECCVRYCRQTHQADEFISPISMCGFLYNDLYYDEGIDLCLKVLSRCDGIVMIPGWENSKGACIELGFAKALGLELMILSKEDTDSDAFSVVNEGYSYCFK